MKRGWALVLLLGPVGLSAQSVTAGDSALAGGDTTAAIKAYEAAVAKDLHNAEAHYKAGVLLMTRHVPGASLSEPRRKAEEHFRYATRFQGDSAKYFLGLAEAFRTESDASVRGQVAGLLEHAAELGRKHPTPLMAPIEYEAAKVEWGRYERYAHHYLFAGDQHLVDVASALDNWPYVEHFARDEIVPASGDLGEGARVKAEADLRAALAANPRFINAAGLLVVLMGEQGRWPEVLDVGRTLLRVAADSGRAWAVAGLGYARADRWAEAQAAFDTALMRMTPAQRAPYDNLAFLLNDADQARWATLPPEDRPRTTQQFLASAQPLFLLDRNDARSEFYARLTYVMHRWGDPLRGRSGLGSDIGEVYLRWGEPDVWAKFGSGTNSVGADTTMFEAADAAERDVVLWVYWPTHHRFVFSFGRGYGAFAFDGEFRAYYHEAQELNPVRFDNVPIERRIDTADVQVAQFRAEVPRATDLAVFSLMPVGRMVAASPKVDLDLETALILRDGLQRDVARLPQHARVHGGDSLQIDRRSWRLTARPNRYLMHVEALIPSTEQAARSSSYLNVRSFTGDTLDLSDVIIASRVTPKDTAASRWTDFFIEPSSGRLAPTESFGLLWEVYNLVPDAGGVSRYHVELRLTIQSIERHGFAATVLGGIGDAVGLSAKGDKAVSLGYDRQARGVPHGRQVEYLTVTLRDAPNATYELVVQITDKVSGRVVTQIHPLIVSPTPLSR